MEAVMARRKVPQLYKVIRSMSAECLVRGMRAAAWRQVRVSLGLLQSDSRKLGVERLIETELLLRAKREIDQHVR